MHVYNLKPRFGVLARSGEAHRKGDASRQFGGLNLQPYRKVPILHPPGWTAHLQVPSRPIDGW